ncbi:Hsp20/alpha crystallin family protein [Roseimaritima ulvae]|uniref:18 kDa heat shock protein n=1 Tax=Roseimaritima ulvae TaxID=980254 RepID=A0A5B9QUX1_9BACT|nr:Hsp20/alpha crystallin family protein [Roseimaritima ulvae]QEG41752.1 18 kDa heat shock protein [Roseimaritima ulvae]
MNGSVARRDNRSEVSRLYDDPFASLENRMNHLFRGMFDSSGGETGLANYPVDVDEDDDQITIEAEMPGFKPDEIDVHLENGVLTIKAERSQKADNGKKKHLAERRYTRVQRSFSLPRTVDGSDVEASLDQGILTLTLKKTEESKPRRIQIQQGNHA